MLKKWTTDLFHYWVTKEGTFRIHRDSIKSCGTIKMIDPKVPHKFCTKCCPGLIDLSKHAPETIAAIQKDLVSKIETLLCIWNDDKIMPIGHRVIKSNIIEHISKRKLSPAKAEKLAKRVYQAIPLSIISVECDEE